MRHSGRYASDRTDRISYEFKVCGKWNSVAVQTTGAATIPQEDSQLSFIAEHYWGYSQQRDGSTMENQVEHPPWEVETLIASDLQCDALLSTAVSGAKSLLKAPSHLFWRLGLTSVFSEAENYRTPSDFKHACF